MIKNFIDDTLFPKGIFGYRASYMLLRPHKIITEIYYEIKYAFQRMFRGYDDAASFSADYYLADLIIKLVKDIKKYEIGFPAEFLESKEFWNYTPEEEKQARENWSKVLDDIVEGFELYLDDVYVLGEEDKIKKFETALDLFCKNFRNLNY